MAKAQLVTDVSSWNPDTLTFYRDIAKRGVRAVIVKLTEGTTYQNPKAKAQIKAAWAAGMHVHAYHYAHFSTTAQAKAEATFFAKTAKARGLNHTSVLAADVEDASLPKSGLTALTNTFLLTLKQAGYPKVDLYTWPVGSGIGASCRANCHRSTCGSQTMASTSRAWITWGRGNLPVTGRI